MLSKDRQEVLNKISEYEKQGLWDKDVENDPETKILLPNKVDYLSEKFSTRFFTKIANRVAVIHYERKIKNGDLVIKKINGIENFSSVCGGAIITCNHFSVNDNYAVYRAVKDYLGKGKNFYKVIREGNYTNFKWLYGFLFKHCNTLPLSSNTETMKKFLRAVDKLLNNGEKILIYPEQAMWWNYKKPRPLKSGAFRFAVKNSVPVIPVFITMEDAEKKEKNGSFVQAYTLNFLSPIYPRKDLSLSENIEYIKEKNYREWVNVYQNFYGVPLKY